MFPLPKKVIRVFVVGVVVFVALAMSCDRQKCYRDWADSGMPVRWGPVIDCQVSPSPGKWVPAKSYRETP